MSSSGVGEYVGGVEQRHAMAVGHTVKADDGAVDVLLHNVPDVMRLGVEFFQLGEIAQLVGRLGTAAVVRLDDDRVADLLDKGAGLGSADNMVARHRYTRSDVASFILLLYLMRSMKSFFAPVLMLKSVRSWASISSQYSLLDSIQSILP